MKFGFLVSSKDILTHSHVSLVSNGCQEEELSEWREEDITVSGKICSLRGVEPLYSQYQISSQSREKLDDQMKTEEEAEEMGK